jgi:hypothetical protein
MRISVMLPTRGRPELLRGSVMSLVDNAAHPETVEILVAIDPDDAWPPWDIPGMRVWTAPERYGYRRLEEYYNALAEQATGDWLFLWNDDAVMRTSAWDNVIAGHKPALLWPSVLNGYPHCNAFPIWPRVWTQVLGHVSLGAYSDSWMQWVGEQLDVEVPTPLLLEHRTPDDLTFREGSGLKPRWSDGMFDGLLAADVAKLREYLT